MRILVLDDDEVDRLALRRALLASGLDVELVEADSLGAARGLLAGPASIDAVLADYRLPDGSVSELLRELRTHGEEPAVVVVTGQGDERVAVELMKAGATDYLAKSELTPRRLRKVLRTAVRVAAAERRAAEAQRAEHHLVRELARERARLQEAVAQRDEVLAIVSHDLRSPLSNVSMAIESLEDDALDTRERRRLVELAQRSVGRMVRLIEDLLDVTRIERGALSLEIGEHDAAQLATDVIDAMRIGAQRKGIELLVQMPADLGSVRADRMRIAQVIQNLVANAVKFSPPGSVVRIVAVAADATVRYRVHDEGPGVPAEVRSHVFERFWQARRAARGGAGLGLAIVKGIVEAHGGCVELVDTERGACFSFTLPRLRTPARALG